MKAKVLILLLVFACTGLIQGQQKISFKDVNGKAGFTIDKSDASGIQVSFQVKEITLTDVEINGERMTEVGLPGVFLPNNEGAPNLPGTGRYILIPNDAAASLEILDYTTEVIQNVNVSPAPRIPKETEDGLEYRKNPKIYSKDLLYPAQFVQLSAPVSVRGMNMVMLGFTPFQYNPVSRELIVYKSLKVRIKTEGGMQTYGEDRLRSRWFDPLIEDMVLNPEAIPSFDYNKTLTGPTDVAGCEYLIICPNGAVFQQWADTIRRFREIQGIHTLVKTLADVGGNTTTAIETYINNVYNTWTPVPAAILLLGDYGTDANTTITSPIWNSYCVSDNILGDVNGDDLPDIVMARMTAQNAAQLQVMIKKFINYEKNPPVSEGFYEHPVTALGWQTERWFQVCSEVVGGFWSNALGKTPVRVNAVYGGNPLSDPWSTASNTTTVINYFGPSGLNYIPASPQSLGGFSGGTPAMVNTAINNGAFMVQHRDHGYEQGWGEPSYSSTSISGLTNTDLSFIMSVNCLTGKYNYASEVFAEKFHRYTYNGNHSGALGILAASEVSYSFVNDAFVWGMYDNMWPNFMPLYGTNPASRGILPAFGNAAGKYFLEQSSWPYNSGDKDVTHHLFHHHGDAFLTVYSEVPQNMAINHSPVIYTGVNTFTVTANVGALICLSLNGQILGTGTGTGAPLNISIPGNQIPPDYITVVVTKQNYYRYSAQIQVVPPSGPYVVKDVVSINDAGGNNNGQIDYSESVLLSIGMRNVGVTTASNTNVTISCSSPYVIISDASEYYGTIAASATITVSNAFSISTTANVPDNQVLNFTVTATSGSNTWTSYFTLTVHAPVLAYSSHTLTDPAGNGNNRADPGETALIALVLANSGSSQALSVNGTLTCTSPYVTIGAATQSYGTINASGNQSRTYSITAAANTPAGHTAVFTIQATASNGQSWSGVFNIIIGQIPVLVIDLDGNSNSAPAIQSAVQANGLSCDLSTSIPSTLNLYTSVFLCLGIYSDNHVLTSTEGSTFAAYLNAGGKLYLEGGDCWAYDAQTSLQPMFKISGLADGSGDLTLLNGVSGTFTSGLSLAYSGENNYIDHLGVLAGSTAYAIFNNPSPAYTTAIAYAGSTYKTIGVSHEFGSLANGTSPSTRNELMWRYLEFFGLVNNSLAASFTASDTLIIPGESVNFTSTATGNITTWAWSFPGGSPATSNLQNPQVTYTFSGVYDVTLTVSNAYLTGSLTKTNHIVVGINSFSGNITYDNPLQSPMTNTLVNLKQGSSVMAFATTDNTGNFSFDNIPLGSYTVVPQCTKPWGGGNGTDALLITKHFVGLAYLSGVRVKAADIDHSAYVNTVDALGVQRRFIQMITSFPSGDWAFETPVINLTGSFQPDVNIKTVCYGDVNGSFSPAVKAEPTVVQDYAGEIQIVTGEEFNLDVRAATAGKVGAVSLFLHIPACYELLDVTGPQGKDNPPVYVLQDELLGVCWVDAGEGQESSLLQIKLRLKTATPGLVGLAMLPWCEIADPNGQVYEALRLTIPLISLRSEEALQFDVIPNPVSESCRLEFSNLRGSTNRIQVYSVDGRLLNTLILQENQTSMTWKPVNAAGDALSSGVYSLRLGSSGQVVVKKLIISH